MFQLWTWDTRKRVSQHYSCPKSSSSSLSWRSSLSLPFYWPYSAPGLQLHLICFAEEASHETTRLIIEATSNSNLWPLTRKRSLRFAVFAWIAARMPCISRSNGSVPAKKICIRSNGSGPCKENLHPFEWLGLSVQRKFNSLLAEVSHDASSWETSTSRELPKQLCRQPLELNKVLSWVHGRVAKLVYKRIMPINSHVYFSAPL